MLYIAGLFVFFALHTIPFSPTRKTKLTDRFGAKRYKTAFRIIALIAVAMICFGWNDFSNIYFYEPPVYLKQIHIMLMLPTTYLLVAAEIPNNIKRLMPNPMLTGMKLWATSHMLANGDLRSMILFISILVFCVIAVILTNKRDEKTKPDALPLSTDIRAIVLSVVIYCTVIYFHGSLFGMPVLPYLEIL